MTTPTPDAPPPRLRPLLDVAPLLAAIRDGELPSMSFAFKAGEQPGVRPLRGMWVNLAWPPRACLFGADDAEPRAELFVEPRDLWVGAYVDTQDRELFVCLLPGIVGKIRWSR